MTLSPSRRPSHHTDVGVLLTPPRQTGASPKRHPVINAVKQALCSRRVSLTRFTLVGTLKLTDRKMTDHEIALTPTKDARTWIFFCMMMTATMWNILSSGVLVGVRYLLRPVYSDTTQLNSTRRRVVDKFTAWTTVDSVCRSWRHKQKHDWLGCTLFNWVSWVQLSCVAINTLLTI